ncbi:MAG: hypothetical protein CM15mP23_05240 [Cryomorphaceae bacterium]|nr:MAG: hypothetical protein CM15mP23_05240 [Cryomorphaceae bacterium]
MSKLAIVGLGLIGGSMALDLKKRLKYQIFGIDKNPEHIKSAIRLGIIDKEANFSDLKDIEVVIVAVPVNHIAEVSQKVLDNISDGALVLDVGSVKKQYL